MTFNPVAIYALCTILPVTATLAVLARMKVRVLRKATLKTDDWTAVAGLVVLWCIAVIVIVGAVQGLFGAHTLQDPQTGATIITQLDRRNIEYMWIVVVISILSIGLVKLSVVLLYRRIFAISRAFNIYTSGLLALVTAWAIAFLAANLFQCGIHPESAWTNVKMIEKYCYDTSPATSACLLTNLIVDLMILGAPIGIIWRLHMSLARKLQVTGIFALGLFSVAAGAARAYILLTDTYGPDEGFFDLRDSNTDVVMWTLIEIVAALVGCCLPRLRPLLVDTSLGRSLSSLLSTFSLRSNKSRLSFKEEDDEELAIITIGGARSKGRANMLQGTESNCSAV
ncbi:hypothetical protein CC86DRAFT_291709 [Ophiobolus disseminans]|uniref:Rhodopsin domain-containing protein n=1 Tax=Ophiobolus disseminans TaxID=1469910 RepID=A0A6A7A1P1_9PLEO|nr:hypothetical protein CC86DRAFT_291709 [Ophiobolus disseminans]